MSTVLLIIMFKWSMDILIGQMRWLKIVSEEQIDVINVEYPPDSIKNRG